MIYTWKLKSLIRKDVYALKNVIVQTYWECIGTDEEGYSGTFNGATPFNVPEGSFIEYTDLTEEIVLGWIKEQVVGSYKDHIDEQILKQINKQKVIETQVSEDEFPWSNT